MKYLEAIDGFEYPEDCVGEPDVSHDCSAIIKIYRLVSGLGIVYQSFVLIFLLSPVSSKLIATTVTYFRVYNENFDDTAARVYYHQSYCQLRNHLELF